MINPKENLPKKVDREIITPHRLTVAILLKEFFKFRTSDIYLVLPLEKIRPRHVQDFCILILKLIQNPDLTLLELRNLLVSDKYTVHKHLLKEFDKVLDNVNSKGMRYFLDLIDEVRRLILRDMDTVRKTSHLQINKSSVVVTAVLQSFKRYYEPFKRAHQVNPDPLMACKYKEISDWNSDKDQWSRRQAELFIASQAALLSNNEGKALNPKELQFHIRNLLKSNPDLAEAHFLSYLNYLRVKEFCGAVHSLHHCFDRMNLTDNRNSGDEKNKAYRFAALNLAVLHYQMEHREEAFAALKEAITMAQEANDNVCLQHALSWLYCLINTNKDKLLEHSILKSLDLNLTYIMSLGIQSFVQYAGVTSGNPKQIFETITKSDIVNCQHSYGDLISASYAHKSSLWLFYGKTEMSSLWSQLLLHLNMETAVLGKSFCGEPLCLSICNLANYFTLQGEYSLTNSLISLAKEHFPNEPVSNSWILCENLFVFIRSLHNCHWFEAETAAQKISVVDPWESKLRLTELLLYRKDYSEAHQRATEILKHKLRIDYQIRAMILLAEIQCNSSFPESVPPGIISLLNSSLVYANDFHLNYLSSIVHLHLANVQLLLGMPGQALELLEGGLVHILTHGGHFDRARAVLLYVKCVVANAGHKPEGERNKIILEAAKMLDDVRSGFEKVEAFSRVKDVLYLQARLYNEVGANSERNKCALDYRLLEEDHPVQSESYLLTFL
ncbi:anaphase-promoting complex subunit 5 isoform X2 [Agrilus planipennis]|uniref:Anaphase-promoting complex subunit 5 n=1 Tax=Agrilus planipennis TaxID=224129 RepID=A0A1W4XHN9_AGRPL|nr:anaphase-promoting complex subunit 5 isoform X2 [Agrilus planipennis]